VREHTQAIRAPRALWVPFILGRPFGVPNDAAFQRRVLLAVLRLLEAPRGGGPLLADFPEEAPDAASEDSGADGEAFACPVNFSRAPGVEDEDADAWQQEISELASWHRLAVQRRGRSTARLSGLAPDAAARYLADFIANAATPVYRDDLARGLSLRLACEDIKAYYLEAVNAQPGRRAAREAQAWFWRETVAGRMLLRLREACAASADASVKQFGLGNLVPRAVLHGLGAGH
jgi:hypothetical protein